MRADLAIVAVCRRMDVRFSITIRGQSHRGDNGLDAQNYWMDGAADVAETTYTPFQSEADAAPVGSSSGG